MEATVEIAGHELIVDYEFKITSRGCPATGPSYSSGGEPAEAAEFEITVLGARFPKQHADVPELEIPKWLEDILVWHLMERDDVNEIVQQADYDPYYGRDPDDERDRRLDDEERESQSQNDEF